MKAASCETVVKAFIWAKLLATSLVLNARGIAENAEKREIGVIKWFRCIAQKLGKIRELILREEWIALARYPSPTGSKGL